MGTRGIPYGPEEFRWAHNRPSRHRTPFPRVGDTVCYRHDSWGEVVEGTVVWVQPEDDVDDPHVYRAVTQDGVPVLHEGRSVMARRADPWRLLRLRTRYGLVETREARLRGSPGWLPLDWRARARPMEGPTVGAHEFLPDVVEQDPPVLLRSAPGPLAGVPLSGEPAPAQWGV